MVALSIWCAGVLRAKGCGVWHPDGLKGEPRQESGLGWGPTRLLAEWTEQDLPRLCGATMTSDFWRILKTVTTLGNLQISLSGLCPNISESIIVDLPTNADFNVKPVNCGAPYLQTNQYAINCHVNNILQNRAYSNLHKKYLTVQLDCDATLGHRSSAGGIGLHHVLIQTVWIDLPVISHHPRMVGIPPSWTKPLVRWFYSHHWV